MKLLIECSVSVANIERVLQAFTGLQQFMATEFAKLHQHLNQLETHMANEMEDLQAEVSRDTDVVNSAVTLLQSLHDQIIAAGTDPAKLAALTTSLKANTDALAAAVAANTPAAPTT